MRASEAVKVTLGELRVGRPRVAGNLKLIPLYGGNESPPYVTADEAVRRGDIEFREKGQGEVPWLLAVNKGSVPVLVVEGDILNGGLQDRVVNVSVLLPARATLAIPVSCVEEGRWHHEGRSGKLNISDAVSPPAVRLSKAPSIVAALRTVGKPEADQHSVWAAVRDELEAAGASSPTGAIYSAFEALNDELAAVAAALDKPSRLQTGVVVCVGDMAVAVDLFDRPKTLASMWHRLLRGYALGSVTAASTRSAKAIASEVIRDACEAKMTDHDTVGLGTRVAISGQKFVGHALVWEEAVVHLSLFPVTNGHRSRRGGGRNFDEHLINICF